MNTQERLTAIRAKCVELLANTKGKFLARHQPCGCLICICEHETQCQGCGASHCGTHPLGAIPNPVYEEPCAGPAEAGWAATIAAIDNILGCHLCAGTGITQGWQPSYNDPDNITLAQEAEPCCEHAKAIIAAWPEELLK